MDRTGKESPEPMSNSVPACISPRGGLRVIEAQVTVVPKALLAMTDHGAREARRVTTATVEPCFRRPIRCGLPPRPSTRPVHRRTRSLCPVLPAAR